jgi:hypothetical protein
MGNRTPYGERLRKRRTTANRILTVLKVAHGGAKLIPPGDVLLDEWDTRVEKQVREDITARILREAGLEDRIAEAIEAIGEWHPRELRGQTGRRMARLHRGDRASTAVTQGIAHMSRTGDGGHL